MYIPIFFIICFWIIAIQNTARAESPTSYELNERTGEYEPRYRDY